MVGFLVRLLGPLIKPGLLLIRHVLKPLAKSVLILLGLTKTASAIDTDTVFWSGMTTLIISKEEKDYIRKIFKSVEDAGLLIKNVSETIKNKAKEQKDEFLAMLLVTLGASLLGSLLID